MRVLLINTNQEKHPYPLVPIGLTCVASALAKTGHEVKVTDLCFATAGRSELETAICSFQPQAIGVSVRNIDNADMMRPQFFLDFPRECIRICRELSSAAVIIGGSAVNIDPEGVLAYLGADYGVFGDGELPMLRLLQALEGKLAIEAVPGLVHRQDGLTNHNPIHRETDIGALPVPRPHRWIDFERYRRWGAPMPVQTKRGCKFECVYCVYGLLEGRQHRMKPAGDVALEMEELAAEARPRSFEFVDSVFNAPESHAKQVCEALIRRGWRTPLQTMGINPAPTSLELFRLMRRAGFEGIICTPESASDHVLEQMRKGFTVARVQRTAEFVAAAGLPTMWVFLFGGPGETEDTVRETLTFIDRHIRPPDVVFMTLGIRIYRGTTMERIAREQGVIDDATDLLRPVYYLSPEIRLERLVQMVAAEAARHSHYCFISDVQIPWVPALTRFLTLLRLTPPLWRYVAPVNRILKLAGRRPVAYYGVG